MPRFLPDLKQFYYLDHFQEMLACLQSHHRALLGAEELDFIVTFLSLSKEAQGLYVRMANRKGSIFPIAKLCYSEINNVAAALAELLEQSFVTYPEDQHQAQILALKPRSELLLLLRGLKTNLGGLSKLTKSQILEHLSGSETVHVLGNPRDYIFQGRSETLEFLLFVYFGRLRDDLKAFALRDLGLVQAPSMATKIEARFQSHDEAYLAYQAASLSRSLESADLEGTKSILSEATQLRDKSAGSNLMCLDKLFNRIGKQLERNDQSDLALKAYEKSKIHPARERISRILFNAGHIKESRTLLEEICHDPLCDDELIFAEDFLGRKFQGERINSLTKILREAPTILVDEAYRNQPEKAAIDHYEKLGMLAFHTENNLWPTLCGLLFWNELQSGARRSHFEFCPNQWLDGSFLGANDAVVAERLKLITEGRAKGYIAQITEDNLDKPNGIFSWNRKILAAVDQLLDHGDPAAIRSLLIQYVGGASSERKGFPDLMVVADKSIEFIEIKAEGDQIRRHQLARMNSLRRSGFAVSVLRTDWFVDPSQDYVVVDIETTGGRSGKHRITEIGAVKIRQNKVVETFSTLVNPERKIPPFITKLTGISDGMVAEAPTFADISLKLMNFLEGSVFVAHSVRFDYGFIKTEFERLGLRFRSPTFLYCRRNAEVLSGAQII